MNMHFEKKDILKKTWQNGIGLLIQEQHSNLITKVQCKYQLSSFSARRKSKILEKISYFIIANQSRNPFLNGNTDFFSVCNGIKFIVLNYKKWKFYIISDKHRIQIYKFRFKEIFRRTEIRVQSENNAKTHAKVITHVRRGYLTYKIKQNKKHSKENS